MSDGGCYSSFSNSNDQTTAPSRTPSPEQSTDSSGTRPDAETITPDQPNQGGPSPSTVAHVNRPGTVSTDISRPPAVDDTSGNGNIRDAPSEPQPNLPVTMPDSTVSSPSAGGHTIGTDTSASDIANTSSTVSSGNSSPAIQQPSQPPGSPPHGSPPHVVPILPVNPVWDQFRRVRHPRRLRSSSHHGMFHRRIVRNLL
eukprot:13060_1